MTIRQAFFRVKFNSPRPPETDCALEIKLSERGPNHAVSGTPTFVLAGLSTSRYIAKELWGTANSLQTVLAEIVIALHEKQNQRFRVGMAREPEVCAR